MTQGVAPSALCDLIGEQLKEIFGNRLKSFAMAGQSQMSEGAGFSLVIKGFSLSFSTVGRAERMLSLFLARKRVAYPKVGRS